MSYEGGREERFDRDGYRGRDGRGGGQGRDGGRPRGGKPYGKRDDRGGKPYGDRKPYGERGGRDGKPYGDRDRKPYGDRDGKPRGGRPYGERKPYGDRDRKPFDRDGGPRGERKPYGGGHGDGPRGGKPFGDRKPYGDRGGKKPFDRGHDRDGAPRGGSFGGRDQRDDRFDRAPREKLHVDRGGGRGFRKDDEGPRRGDAELLRSVLERISGKGYAAYRDVEGVYAFDSYELSIHRSQRDPFAPPSRVTVRVPQDVAGFDAALFDEPWKRVALQDRVLRAFNQAIARNPLDFADFIKGGAFTCSRPGQEVLERSACQIDGEAVQVSFEASFPARERAIATREFEEMFFTVLPRIVRDSLLAVSYTEGELEAVANLADDQHALREQMEQRGLVAFVADGAVLPRESGISARPMENAVPFRSPESLRVALEAPHAGTVEGMGVPRGVTLVVGGGYHGKSTLLKAIESGVYDHIAGDGREFVLCDRTAMKLRAEDGRSVRGTDISLFINNLPNNVPTDSFWTDDASGSTSQAASTAEALEAGCRAFLIDEDTSATNFMVREELMQAVIAREGEPITPFVERLRDLYERAGVSTIVVAGSSGAFFGVADTIIQMENYEPRDIADAVKEVCAQRGAAPVPRAEGFALPGKDRTIATPQHPLTVKTASEARKDDKARREGAGAKGPERLRVKVLGGVDVRVGGLGADMRFVEQLADAEQAKALGCIVKWCMERDLFSRQSVCAVVAEAMAAVEEGGLAAVADTSFPACGLALPRREEVFACINRLRPRD